MVCKLCGSAVGVNLAPHATVQPIFLFSRQQLEEMLLEADVGLRAVVLKQAAGLCCLPACE